MTRMCTDVDAIFWSNASVDVSLKLVHDHVHYMRLCSIEKTECAFYSYHFMHTVPGHEQWWMGGGGGGGGGGGDVGSVANS